MMNNYLNKNVKYYICALVAMQLTGGLAESFVYPPDNKVLNYPTSAHGYFKCKYQRMEIVNTVPLFNVFGEGSTNYNVNIVLCYKQMPADVVRDLKRGCWLSNEQYSSIKVDGFPVAGYPWLVIHLNLDYPLGKMPPRYGTNNCEVSLALHDFGAMGNMRCLTNSVLEYQFIPVDDDRFRMKGHAYGCAHIRTPHTPHWEKYGDDDWEWDITFDEIALHWSEAKNGVHFER